MEWKKDMKAIKFSKKSNLEKLKLLHPTGTTPLKVFASDC
jgi:hypothetical protein